MKKNIKRYLAFILAFALMATYSFGPQNINVFAEGNDEPSAAAEQQADSPQKKAPDPKPVEKPVTPEVEQSAPSTDDSEQASSSDNSSSDAEEPTEAVTEEPAADAEEATEETTEEEDSYPAQSFSRTVNGMTVKISAPEGALPEDSSVKVKAVSASKIESAVENLIEDAQVVKAVDITFYNNEGKEIEPKKNVSVTFASGAFKGLEDAQVVHIKDNGAAEK